MLENGTAQQMDIKIGDHILFLKFAGVEFKLDDEEYLILNENDILGKFGI